MDTQQKQFDTALASLTPQQRATYTAANPTIGVGGVQQSVNQNTGGYAPITPQNLATVNPLQVPVTNKTTPSLGAFGVSAPTGTQLDANGNATIPPPAKTTESPAATSGFEWLKKQFQSAGDELNKKGEVTTQLQNEQQLAQKTEQATKDYNAYNQKKLQYQQQIDSMYSKTGGTTAGVSQEISDFSRKANADLANLAIQAQASQGLLSAAQQTIKDKLDAQFQPIQERIDFLAKFSQINANDLTESEKFKLTQKENQTKTDLANITKTADDLHQNMLQNGAPQSVYSALDKITSDYTSGKITAQEAQTKMYQAAGRYGTDIQGNQLRQAQIDKLYAEAKDKEASNGAISRISKVNPDSPTYIQDLLIASSGGAKLTGDQINPISKALTVVGQIDSLQSSLSKTDTGPIIGILKSANPYDTQAQLIKGQLQAIIPNLARGVYGEVGVLTDNDIANYRKTIGNLKSTNELNDLLLSMTLTTVKNGIDDRLEVAASAGRDVSGFVNLRSRLEDRINNINSRIGLNPNQQKQATSADLEYVNSLNLQ